MRRKRSRFALLGILALAFSVTAGLTLSDVAAAQKKGKGGGSKTFKKGGGAIPDATSPGAAGTGNGGEFHRGLLSSKVVVGQKFAGAKIKDLNVEVTATHNDLSDLFIQLVGPNGRLVTLYDGTDNNPPGTVGPPHFSLGRLGPTTFDDQATLFLDDTNSCPGAPDGPCAGTPDGGGVEAFAPYAGAFKPVDGALSSLGKKLQGTWVLLVFDLDAFTGGSDVPQVGALGGWKLIAKLKGGKK
jgi:hypothetical protein